MPKPTPPILAVNARVGAGKTSLLDYFRVDGYRPAKASLADALKNEVANVFGVERSFLDENKNQFRSLLIAWADTRRYFNPTVWVDRLFSEMAADYEMEGPAAFADFDFIYCDDMRYLNEFDAFKERGAVTIQLVCPEKDSVAYMISQGMSQQAAWAASESPGEIQLLSARHFDITIDAPRQRSLQSIYGELIGKLIDAGVLEDKQYGS